MNEPFATVPVTVPYALAFPFAHGVSQHELEELEDEHELDEELDDEHEELDDDDDDLQQRFFLLLQRLTLIQHLPIFQ